MENKTVYLMGIGGMGMVALAGLFKAKGWQVTGSDKGEIYPPASTELEHLSIKAIAGYDAKNITKDLDLVIVGNVISKGHPEYERVLELKIPYTSMAQALGEYFVQDKSSVVVCGTHGKTTTASLMAYILNQLGEDPGFFIGGIPHQFKQGYQLGQGQYFVLEGDEYDTACFEKTPKFLHYKTQHLLLTSIEFDHADIYESLAQIKDQFRKLFEQISDNKAMVVCGDDQNIRMLMQEYPDKQFISYGERESNDWYVKDYTYQGDGIFCYEFYKQDEKLATIKTKMMGKHNAINALGCMALCETMGLDLQKVAQAIGSFEGVTRRQQHLSSHGQVHIYDDFAHHPTAVEKTLAAFKPIAQKNGGKLWALFEPRSNTSRRNTFQNDWPIAFKEADVVLMTKVYEKADGLKDKLDVQKLKEDLQAQGKTVFLPQNKEELVQLVTSHAKAGDTLLFMSNGDFGNAREAVVEHYQS
ncbi:MAG TPA: UDP-N-acetylmuramate--L-alanine ligase [Oligoflexia bacterium]|nr:UDP-N-acetylmuramate--L-alanine ligase [Oligoflexia bacterium]HMR25534.1 UDP-N-acetylmuramate--L-alanine ligase [Oligoflexia bacterium]